MAGEGLIKIRELRIQKAKDLRKIGIDPYPSKSNRNIAISEINQNFDKYEGKEFVVAGRMMSFREHGKLAFADVQDPTGSIQLYIREDEVGNTDINKQTLGLEHIQEYIDIGDIIEAYGKVTKTKTGEISILVKRFRLLTKSIRPLPDKWEGLKDREKLFRKRYLDTILNPDKKWRFRKTAEITFALREFLHKKGFLEIKTPIIQPVYGGGMAKPFKTHVNALGEDFYLAVAHELYLKRLITAGFEKVYNIVGYFRNEGIDRTHNPEFNMLETMTAYENYEYNMDLIEEMYKYVTKKVFNKTEFEILGENVDFGQEWERITMVDAVKKYAEIDFNKIEELDKAYQVLDQIGYEDEKPETIGECLVKVFEEKVEDKLIQPTFVYGHPVEISPLSKQMAEDPRYVERFEIFIGGIEGGDNWTELNDPIELYERFKDQVRRGRGGDQEAHPMDVDFLEMMEYGMAPTTGLGPGIERLAMMLTGTEYIDDVMFFPMMRKAPITQTQKDIYGEEYLIINDDNEIDEAYYEKIDLDDLEKIDLAEIDDNVKKDFKGIKFGYIVLEGVSLEKSQDELEDLKNQLIKKIQDKYDSDVSNIKESDNLEGFRSIYKQFGVDPNSRLNSSEALIKRIVSGKGIYNINNVVDTYNMTSAEYELPMAAYDLDQIEGKLSLRYSEQGDKITKIGDEDSTQIDEGELVYADEKGVTCLDYNYRDSQRTKITKDTTNIIVFVDGHKDITLSQIRETLAVVAKRLENFTGGKSVGYNIKSTKENDAVTKSTITVKDIPSREDAKDILFNYVEDEYQRLHAEMVAEAMFAYGEKYEPAKAELWYHTGLLHDVDFDKWPETHPDIERVKEITNNSYPEELYDAIKGHVVKNEDYRNTKMAKTLLAVDELAGLFYAVAKMRPKGFDMKVKSIRKKFKNDSFAAKIDRNDIKKGVEEMDIELSEHFEFLIPVFKKFQNRL